MNRYLSSVVFLALAYSIVPTGSAKAQDTWKAEACRREITSAATKYQVVLDDVKLDESSDVPPKWGVIRSEVMQTKFDDDNQWTQKLSDAVRGQLQDAGFFKADVQVQFTHANLQDFSAKHFTVIAHISLGSVYTVSSLVFKKAADDEGPLRSDDQQPPAFPEEALRSVMPVKHGDTFRATAIRDGLDGLAKLYGSNGYIDFVAMPQTEINDKDQTITLVIWLSEGPRFYVNRVEAFGLSPELSDLTMETFRSGDLVRGDVLENFLKQIRPAMDLNARWQDVEVRRNVSRGLVDLLFDFRTCSEILTSQSH